MGVVARGEAPLAGGPPPGSLRASQVSSMCSTCGCTARGRRGQPLLPALASAGHEAGDLC